MGQRVIRTSPEWEKKSNQKSEGIGGKHPKKLAKRMKFVPPGFLPMRPKSEMVDDPPPKKR
ncbi:hypothetical protein [Streptosporangium sp. NPDC087985]|uniref:hypothetical protein n=1 Tax=Streptosporangium sp. NPDC087985 TaxID=3366196 RepID=UPI00380C1F6E